VSRVCDRNAYLREKRAALQAWGLGKLIQQELEPSAMRPAILPGSIMTVIIVNAGPYFGALGQLGRRRPDFAIAAGGIVTAAGAVRH
jgi:hypothetical protein